MDRHEDIGIPGYFNFVANSEDFHLNVSCYTPIEYAKSFPKEIIYTSTCSEDTIEFVLVLIW